jgi:hypothetical protein
MLLNETNVIAEFAQALNVRSNYFSDGTPNWDYIFSDVFINNKLEDPAELQESLDRLADLFIGFKG